MKEKKEKRGMDLPGYVDDGIEDARDGESDLKKSAKGKERGML